MEQLTDKTVISKLRHQGMLNLISSGQPNPEQVTTYSIVDVTEPASIPYCLYIHDV